MTYLVANWKSHHTITQSILWLERLHKLNPTFSPQLKTIICLPFTDLPEFNRQLTEKKLPLLTGAQNVSPFTAGKHTGEVTARMLSELITHCIVGHSERRQQFEETSSLVAQKTFQLLDQGIVPIICLDTPYLEEQIKALIKQDIDPERCLFAYEPQAAIGSGQPVTPHTANQFATKLSFLTSPQVKVLYGGSVTAQNASTFVSQSHIQGILVGTDSLTPTDFSNIINSLS